MQRWPERYSWIFLAGLVVVGVLVVFAYLPGLHGSFCYDDFRSITQNRMLRMTNINRESFRLLYTGPSGDRPVSLFSFALHHYFGLTEPWHFRSVNIAIHVLVAAAVGLVTRRVLMVVGMNAGRALVTCLGVVSLWALHPIQITAVTYVVQRMTSLGALFFWLSFYFYLVARTPPGPGTVRRSVAYVAGVFSLVLFLLGFLSKPHIAILPAMVVATELLLFRSHGRMSRREWTALVAGLVGSFAPLMPMKQVFERRWGEARRTGSCISGLARYRSAMSRNFWFYGKLDVPDGSTVLQVIEKSGLL